jgi:asparagine synthase (glutamine-hydrolysing)
MCGFAGIVAWDDRYRFDRAALGRMSARIAHRGPDGEGVWINHEGEVNAGRPQAGLAHRRLAIIDPDPRSNQPFSDGHGHWIAFNGEIYNYRDIRQELAAVDPDYVWKTSGDTEVLLRAYVTWAEKCLERFNGMFAIAIWDERNQSLFLARDRMGQKPLFYFAEHSTEHPIASLSFASEVGALARAQELASPALQAYLAYGYSRQETFYAGIAELPPATCITVRHRSWSPRTYFHPGSFQPEGRDDLQTARETRRLVARAVERQLVADVPIGCFLSGGVDSSVIAACMRQCGPVDTFSIGFDDPRYDESTYAARVAKHLGTSHHEFRVKPDAVHDLAKLVGVFGQPFGDSSALPTHYLARETRRHVKVALSGDGGDELFGGYDRYRAMRLTGKLDLFPKAARWMAGRAVTALLPRAHPKSRIAHLRRLTRSIGYVIAERYESYMRLFDDPQIEELLGKPLSPGIERMSTHFDWLMEGRTPVECALAVDRVFYLPDDLLTKVDRCSMLHALEVRSPFMDHELVEFAATLTTPQLLKGGPKRMLREAFADVLPAWVFRRKKMGFAVPIGEWFRGELRPMLHDHLFARDAFAATHFNMDVVRRLVDDHERERIDHSQRLYALLMLELWWRGQRASAS